MPRNRIFLTQQDGSTSKNMPRLPKDSSELSNNPGFAKLEHQLDINMVSKSQKITMMLYDLTRKIATHIGKMQWTLSSLRYMNKRFSRTQVKHNSTMENQSHLMVSRRLESTLYIQSNMMADSRQDLLQMDISPKNLLNPSILEWFP